jgi:hypothetical protein
LTWAFSIDHGGKDENAPSVFPSHFSVQGELQRKGIGESLLQHVAEALKKTVWTKGEGETQA